MDEFASAGSLAHEDLQSACREVEDLKRLDIDRDTVEEWWWYALRRRLIEEPARAAIAGEFTLSGRGEDRLAQATAASAGPSSGWEKKALSRVITFVAPSATGLATVWAIAEKNGDALLVGLGVIAAVIGGLLISLAISTGLLQPLWEKYVQPHGLRLDVDWLAGREVRIGFHKLPKVEPKRLTKKPPKPVPPVSGSVAEDRQPS